MTRQHRPQSYISRSRSRRRNSRPSRLSIHTGFKFTPCLCPILEEKPLASESNATSFSFTAQVDDEEHQNPATCTILSEVLEALGELPEAKCNLVKSTMLGFLDELFESRASAWEVAAKLQMFLDQHAPGFPVEAIRIVSFVQRAVSKGCVENQQVKQQLVDFIAVLSCVSHKPLASESNATSFSFTSQVDDEEHQKPATSAILLEVLEALGELPEAKCNLVKAAMLKFLNELAKPTACEAEVAAKLQMFLDQHAPGFPVEAIEIVSCRR